MRCKKVWSCFRAAGARNVFRLRGNESQAPWEHRPQHQTLREASLLYSLLAIIRTEKFGSGVRCYRESDLSKAILNKGKQSESVRNSPKPASPNYRGPNYRE